jgi:hypothetical protein
VGVSVNISKFRCVTIQPGGEEWVITVSATDEDAARRQVAFYTFGRITRVDPVPFSPPPGPNFDTPAIVGNARYVVPPHLK